MNGKVLIVDGHVNYLFGLERKFIVSGIDVVKCDGTGNIEYVLHLLRQNKISFIISELKLPNFHGLEILEKIKSDPDFSQIPYFIYSFVDDEKTKTRAQKLGANHYFLKDEIGLDEFLMKVQKILSNQNKIKNFKYEN
jgi:response regulator RpfG family c-di-GMP phosphodiesterase